MTQKGLKKGCVEKNCGGGLAQFFLHLIKLCLKCVLGYSEPFYEKMLWVKLGGSPIEEFCKSTQQFFNARVLIS